VTVAAVGVVVAPVAPVAAICVSVRAGAVFTVKPTLALAALPELGVAVSVPL